MQVFSQNSEQNFILQACGTAPGRFLEIGAFNPEVFSNTRALYLQGWGGVMIEPSPVPFANLEAAYKGVGSVVLLNVAVVLEPVDSVRMWITDDAVSTTEQGNYDRWKNCAKFNGELEVPAVTLEQIYERYGNFDFVSIDTEGTSVDLLMRLFHIGSYPFSDGPSRPAVICVEHDNRKDEIMAAAAPLGYSSIYESGENVVLAR